MKCPVSKKWILEMEEIRLKKVLMLTVFSLLLVLCFASNAFAYVEVYPDYGQDPAYPYTLNIGPSALNANVFSDSTVESVSFSVYEQNSLEPQFVIEGAKSTENYMDCRWTAQIADPDWASGDYRVDVVASNQAGETVIKSGYVKIQGDNTISGTVSNWAGGIVKYSSIYFCEPGQDYWTGAYGWMDEYGRFGITGLTAGEKWVYVFANGQIIKAGSIMVEVDGVNTTVTSPTDGISLTDTGKLVIVTPKPIVTGRLLTDGQILADAGIAIQKEGSPYEYYWANTDSQGNFGLDLPEGNYVIKEVTTYKGVKYLRVLLHKSFTVAGQTDLGDITVPGANVTGVVTGLPAPKYPGNYDYGISMSFVKSEVYGNPEYFWTNARWDAQNQQYKFDLFLPDGTYSIMAHTMYGQMDTFGELFTVTGADNSYTLSADEGNNIVTVESNQVKINIPANNVNGTVRDVEGNLLQYASMNIRPADADEYDWTRVKWISTDESGSFSLYLPDGDYVISNLYYQGIMSSQPQNFTVTDSAQLDLTLVP